MLLHAVMAFALIGINAPRDDAARVDLEKFEGTWVLVQGEEDGQEIPEQVLKQFRLTIVGNRHTVNLRKDTLEGTHTLDPGQRPKAIDSMDTSGPFADQTMRGIYEIEGDELKVCFARPGQERPEKFTTKDGTGHLLHVWRRARPAADEGRIQGTWRVVSILDSGRKPPEDDKDLKMVITSDTMTIKTREKVLGEWTYKLDPTKEPKWIDFTEKDRTARGIYALEGDDLKICYSEGGSGRSTSFVSEPNPSPNDVLIVLQREKP